MGWAPFDWSLVRELEERIAREKEEEEKRLKEAEKDSDKDRDKKD